MVFEGLVSVPAAASTAIHLKTRPNRSLSGKQESVKMKFLAYYPGKLSPLWIEIALQPSDRQHRADESVAE